MESIEASMASSDPAPIEPAAEPEPSAAAQPMAVGSLAILVLVFVMYSM
jgi:hypothetical protein